MCGIAGLLTFDAALSRQQLRDIAGAMNTSLRHRGPDDEGIWLDAGRVRQYWREHLDGHRNWQYLIWDVLMLETWRERWMMKA